jgi:hypothetical protein
MNLLIALTLALTGCTKGPPVETAHETATSPAPPTETETETETEAPTCGASPVAVTLTGPPIEAKMKYSLQQGDVVVWLGPAGGAYLTVYPTVEGTLDPVTVTATVDDLTTGTSIATTTEDLTGTATAGCEVTLPRVMLYSTLPGVDEMCALDGHDARLVVSVGPVGGAPTVTETIDGTFRALYAEFTESVEQFCP